MRAALAREPVLTRAVARRLVLASFVTEGANSWGSLYNAVSRLALSGGAASTALRLHEGDNPDRATVIEVTWELVLEGIVFPTQPEQNHTFIGLTEYGRRVVSVVEPSPHDPDGYLAALRRRVPDIDPVRV